MKYYQKRALYLWGFIRFQCARAPSDVSAVHGRTLLSTRPVIYVFRILYFTWCQLV